MLELLKVIFLLKEGSYRFLPQHHLFASIADEIGRIRLSMLEESHHRGICNVTSREFIVIEMDTRTCMCTIH